MERPEYPLAAVVGNRRVTLALLLLAIDPLLRGLLIAGGRGSGKTTIARSIQPLLPAGAPFVELPPGATIDRILGGADWAATLASCQWRVSRGLLERADGGLLFSDHVNLLPIATVAQIANVLNTGIVRLERDGAHSVSRASFMWLATYDPDEGEPPSLLMDVLGLHAEMDADASAEDREAVVTRALAFQSGPDEFAARVSPDARFHVERVDAARQALRSVSIGPESRRLLCEWVSGLGVTGNRAEIFALRAARAHAALCGRRSVAVIDLHVASELVIEPRGRTRAAQTNPGRPRTDPGAAVERENTMPAKGPAAVFEAPAIDNPSPQMVWQMPGAGGGADRGGRARARPESNSGRGRYVGSLETDPGHGVVAVDATLRAAAPYQRSRGQEGRRVRILASDLRFKRFLRKTGIAMVIAVDASGSMANNRIQQAKGAVIRLLREAYVHRDSIALVAFRGTQAELLMKLGRSIELARRALDELPTGGGTPLAAGILCALAEARRATCPTLLVLLTDGRPNVSGTGEPVWDEIERLGEAVRKSKTVPILIDTSRGHPAAEKLANMLGAQHLVLPHVNANALYQGVAEAASAIR